LHIRTLPSLAIAGALLAAWLPAVAQEHDWDRAHRIVEKTQADLHHIEHHDIWTAVDRGHYDAAERNLSQVRRDLDNNRLDRGRLNAAIAEVEHITHVDALDRGSREALSGDLHEMQRLRDDWHWR
jgi:hypothetical protein